MSIPVDVTEAAMQAAAPRRVGRVRRVLGLHVEVEGVQAAVGDTATLHAGANKIDLEVVAVSGTSLTCMPYGNLDGIHFGAPVETAGRPLGLDVGPSLLGRVLGGLGQVIDGGPPLEGVERASVAASSPDPLRRKPITEQLALGVRAIDTLVPCGKGQRLGIFAGSGVGKSSLLSMIVRGTRAVVTVLALVGERGREVSEFIHNDLGAEGLARCVVVVATSDEPAAVRVRAAFVATRIAEWFRDQGKDVLLMMDSLTRFAMAQREIGLSAGEPPATRGYPPSVFGILPRLLERAGSSETGSITGLYTILVEGDDMNEPIADTTRAILDGHIVLSRRLATSGHYPSIEILESVSRLERAITSPEQRDSARQLRALLAAYREAKDIIEIGAYTAGNDPEVDRAIALKSFVDAFCKQDISETSALGDSWEYLERLVSAG